MPKVKDEYRKQDVVLERIRALHDEPSGEGVTWNKACEAFVSQLFDEGLKSSAHHAMTFKESIL